MAEAETPTAETSSAEMAAGGYWREDGTYQAPDGWPEGAGWVVKNPDGSIDRWGPATDLILVATTDEPGDGPLPGKLHASFIALPEEG